MCWIVAGLIFGFFVVLAGPLFLFWDALHPAWSESSLTAEFQSIRYESGGLVFRYAVHNLTRHAAQFQATLTEIHTLQANDRPSVGYPNVLLPFNVPARGSHVVEVRLELPAFALQNEALTPPLTPPPPTAAATQFSLENALTDLNGFELVDETNGIRLVLPRGW